ncbi:hypothetical protein [Meridianimarinicoccus aquatilis]|uniref:Uncharacterized protein n=1 Tax=Meridianimarinicoccus aquatilis TaxID=2552766 RepID=A0A4R6AR15_9RHOB|nr:hypothetical protein [Fluviibacterium aquatile]TDL86337.1 hypothetical protein E2L05_13760 [Fluviibacterium aquatile]
MPLSSSLIILAKNIGMEFTVVGRALAHRISIVNWPTSIIGFQSKYAAMPNLESNFVSPRQRAGSNRHSPYAVY